MARIFIAGATLLLAQIVMAADHGPVFGLGTPTNPAGGWSVNLGMNSRNGTGGSVQAVQTALSYGVTSNLKLAVSASLGSKALAWLQ